MKAGLARLTVLVAATFVLTASGAAAGSHEFPLTEVGTIAGDRGDSESYPTGINDRGDVIGVSEVTPGGDEHAFLWDGAMHDVGTLGGDTSRPTGVNDLGQVVGVSTDAAGNEHPFLYDTSGMQELPFDGEPTDINNSGEIVGNAYEGGFLYDQAGYHPLYEEAAEINAINDAGAYVGVTVDGHPLLHDESGSHDLTGEVGTALGVNDFGTVLAGTPGFRTQKNLFVYDGTITQLGRSGTKAWINNCGDVVADPGSTIYHDGAWLDDVRWTFEDESDSYFLPGGINNHGQIPIQTDWDPFGEQTARMETGFECPLPLTAAGSVDKPSVDGGESLSLSFELSNPNATDVTASALTATLPDGFVYEAGSTSGTTGADPIVEEHTLTWPGPFAVPAGGSVLLAFRLTSSSDEGTHTARLSAAAGPYPVVPAKTTVTVRSGLRPIVFLPGIAGSRLKRGGDEIWPDITNLIIWPNDNGLRRLRLAEDGFHEFGWPEDEPERLRATDAIRSAAGKDQYGDAIDHLGELGFKESNGKLHVFPFDWRKSADVNALRLLDFIDDVRGCTDCGRQVDVIAHSQGGLVALDALELDPARRVHALVTIGTPVLGATKALGALQFRSPCFVEIPAHACITNPARIQEVTRNLPGVYDLLPSRLFHAAVIGPKNPAGTPVVFDYDPAGVLTKGAQTYAQWSSMIKRDRNRDVFEQEQPLQDRLADFHANDPNVRVLRIVGHTKGTYETIHRYLKKVCRRGRGCSTVTDTSWFMGNGDGTVPLNSADLHNSVNGFDRRNGVRNCYFRQSHMGLVRNRTVMELAVVFLQRPAKCDGGLVGVSSSALRAAALDAEPDLDGTEEPEPFDALQLEVHGPFTGQLNDQLGNALGADPENQVALYDIPDSDWVQDEYSQTFVLSDTGDFQASMTATEETTGDFRLRRYADNELVESATFELPLVPSGARLGLAFTSETDSLESLRLTVDEDADGGTDATVAPVIAVGDATYDVTPPETFAGAVLARPGVAQVQLLAQDESGGSGVGATTYAFADEIPRPYGSPFEAPLYSTVFYFSVDKAGNFEDRKSLVVDDAPNDKRFGVPLVLKEKLDRTVFPAGDEDWYRFKVSASGGYSAKINGFNGDYDLELYDDAGLLAVAHDRSPSSEELRMTLTPGTYYLRVLGFAGASDARNAYHVRIQ
jgi:probable HAF family extracellular repeat protein